MKTILIYIGTVGVLFLCLLFVLHLGEKLKAPTDISGDWQLNNISVEGVRNFCLPIRLLGNKSFISIEQSGIHLSLAFNDSDKTLMDGKLSNNKMYFEKVLSANNRIRSKCSSTILLKLSLELIKRNNEPDELMGTLSVPSCNCGEQKISAVKKERE